MRYIQRQIYNRKEKSSVNKIRVFFTNCSSTKALRLLMQMHSLSPGGVEQKDRYLGADPAGFGSLHAVYSA